MTNTSVTVTGRRQSIPSLQNIPIRTELGRKIRSAFVPTERRTKVNDDLIRVTEAFFNEMRSLGYVCEWARKGTCTARIHVRKKGRYYYSWYIWWKLRRHGIKTLIADSPSGGILIALQRGKVVI